jgi:hypothetical protein
VYPYDGSVIHGDSQSAHATAPSKYAETHVTVELVKLSKFVTAVRSAASPVSSKFGVRHSLREGPAVIGASDATRDDGVLTGVVAKTVNIAAITTTVPIAINAIFKVLIVAPQKNESTLNPLGASFHNTIDPNRRKA